MHTQRTLNVFYFSFNPVAPTALMKLAQTVTKSVCGGSKGWASRFFLPDKAVVEALVTGCNGDVRSLLNSLQFACLKGSCLCACVCVCVCVCVCARMCCMCVHVRVCKRAVLGLTCYLYSTLHNDISHITFCSKK